MSTLPHNPTPPLTAPPVFTPHAAAAVPQPKRWTREEYYRLADDGWFQADRVELINGEILVVSPQSYPHATAIHLVYGLLSELFDKGYAVRMQVPLIAGPRTEPEPDISVVAGSWRDYQDHPRAALLIVEVSNTTLTFDTSTKASLYASMGVPDYWVLDIENRLLLVHRQPTADDKAQFGHRYQQVQTLDEQAQVSPLEKPAAKLDVADMLPPAEA